MSLTTEAKAAHAAALTAQQAARDAEMSTTRAALRQAATDAVRAVLTRADGTALTLAQAGLAERRADLDRGLMVWGDPDGLLLAAQFREDRWEVRLARFEDGRFRVGSDRVGSLAELGAALSRAV